MREIRYRGKSIAEKKWVFGSLWLDTRDGVTLIWSEEQKYWVRVDPCTVGQYTGLKDRNGKEIYEGDIINWLTHRMDRTGYIEEGCVEFRTEEQANIVINKFSTKDGRDSICNIIHCLNDLKVVGNIHDNPKLLKNE